MGNKLGSSSLAQRRFRAAPTGPTPPAPCSRHRESGSSPIPLDKNSRRNRANAVQGEPEVRWRARKATVPHLLGLGAPWVRSALSPQSDGATTLPRATSADGWPTPGEARKPWCGWRWRRTLRHVGAARPP